MIVMEEMFISIKIKENLYITINQKTNKKFKIHKTIKAKKTNQINNKAMMEEMFISIKIKEIL